MRVRLAVMEGRRQTCSMILGTGGTMQHGTTHGHADGISQASEIAADAAATNAPQTQVGELLSRAAGSSRLLPVTLGWGLAGFVIGALFWHFVGFWIFVSDVVLKGDQSELQVKLLATKNCTELVLHRKERKTSKRPCSNHAIHLAEGHLSGRQDLEPLVYPPSRWSFPVLADDGDADANAPGALLQRAAETWRSP